MEQFRFLQAPEWQKLIKMLRSLPGCSSYKYARLFAIVSNFNELNLKLSKIFRESCLRLKHSSRKPIHDDYTQLNCNVKALQTSKFT